MRRHQAVVGVVLAGLLLASAPSGASATGLPEPSNQTRARKAGADAGPEQGRAAQAAGARVRYRVFATQYNPNTKGSVEVAVPDQCAKFAALGLTSALQSAGCPAGYSTALDYRVVVIRDSGQRAAIPLKDVGPWNIDDNYWDPTGGPRPRRMFTDIVRGEPESQAAFYHGYNTVADCKSLSGSPTGHSGPADQFGRCVLNPAGIDLSVAAAARLGLGSLQNEWVTVSFLWEPVCRRHCRR